jgi:hypothetical protein
VYSSKIIVQYSLKFEHELLVRKSTFFQNVTVPELTPFQLPISVMNPLYHPVTPDETPAAPPGNQITVVAITSAFEPLQFLQHCANSSLHTIKSQAVDCLIE